MSFFCIRHLKQAIKNQPLVKPPFLKVCSPCDSATNMVEFNNQGSVLRSNSQVRFVHGLESNCMASQQHIITPCWLPGPWGTEQATTPSCSTVSRLGETG